MAKAEYKLDDSQTISIIWPVKPSRVFVSTARKGHHKIILGIKIMKATKKIGLGAGLLASAGAATAAVPAAVTTALGDAGVDSLVVAGAVLAVIVGIFAVKLMRKSL